MCPVKANYELLNSFELIVTYMVFKRIKNLVFGVLSPAGAMKDTSHSSPSASSLISSVSVRLASASSFPSLVSSPFSF